MVQLGPSSCLGRPPAAGDQMQLSYSYSVHPVWILCQDLIRWRCPVTYELIRRDTVSLFYHFTTLSHSADSGALIGPSLLPGQPFDRCGTGGPRGGIGLRGGRVSPSKNKSHTRFFSAKFSRLNPFGQAQPLKSSIYQRISAF